MKKASRTIKRRRRESKTDYKARLNLLKSETPRLIVRKTNRQVIAQIVESEIAQDKVIMGVSSVDLIGKGWPKELSGSLKSIPACYLVGYMIGKKYGEKKVIFDSGLQRNIHKGRLYAVLKGAIDAGMQIKCKKDVLPEDEKIVGKSKEIFSKVKEAIS